MFGISFGKNKRVSKNKPVLNNNYCNVRLYDVTPIVKRSTSAHRWVEVCNELDCVTIGNIFVNNLSLPSTVKSRYYNYE